MCFRSSCTIGNQYAQDMSRWKAGVTGNEILRTVLNREQMLEGIGHPCHVRQPACVQNAHERLSGLGDDGRQPAALGDAAGAAIHQRLIPFGMADDLTNGDLRRRPRQLQAASASPGCRDEACPPKVLNDLHQVVLGNAMGLGDLADRHELSIAGREVDQRTKGIVGVAAQFHDAEIEVFATHV